jgi:hypothetical protein
VIDLVYYHGKSVKEVAQIVGIPEATVKCSMRAQELAALIAQLVQPAAPSGERLGNEALPRFAARLLLINAHGSMYNLANLLC